MTGLVMARVAMYFEYFQSRREKELNDQLRKGNSTKR